MLIVVLYLQTLSTLKLIYSREIVMHQHHSLLSSLSYPLMLSKIAIRESTSVIGTLENFWTSPNQSSTGVLCEWLQYSNSYRSLYAVIYGEAFGSMQSIQSCHQFSQCSSDVPAAPGTVYTYIYVDGKKLKIVYRFTYLLFSTTECLDLIKIYISAQSCTWQVRTPILKHS